MSRRTFFKVLLVAVAILGLLVLSDVLSAQGGKDAAFERVKEVQAKHTARLMKIKGVVGTAIGLDKNNQLAVTVLAAKRGVAGIPKKLDGVPVQVVVTGKFYALAKGGKPGPPDGKGPKEPKEDVDRTARFDRPVPIGVSTGHPAITAGTIGCRVAKGGKVYALSNNHVYANENLASIGDNVLQPGDYDGGIDPDDAIGTLAAFELIMFDGSDNIIDAAIASSTTDLLGNATPSDGYGVPKSATMVASLNQAVKKYGRTTGLTKGRIYLLNATVNVGYDSGVARFVNQIIITPGTFSAGGDSGSLVLSNGKGKNRENDRKPIGLLFAGSDSFTVANPIGPVLTRFGVTIDGE